MEDAADAVVPLRPGFDIQMRGYNRNQVAEHVELLEDQLRLVTIDRNEAVQLNSDLRKLCDDTRRALDQAEQRLKAIESSDTGLPAASQRVQNMLNIAEEEVQTLRDQAKRQAEIIRGTAETEARELIGEAERTAAELRTECGELVADVERRRDELRREHEQQLGELRTRERKMRQAIRDEYKRTMAAAQEEADELMTQTRRQCEQWDAESERMRLQAVEEINRKKAELEELRGSVLSAMESARRMLDESASTLRAPRLPSDDGEAEHQVPEQRDESRTVPVLVDGQQGNGSHPDGDHARQN
ncbi:coiled-coil domain-containing protein [Saccharopolyspora rosea]|uniref:DivIVA protein n=1 Tax=Saccharopolyspora rosea TaxID=524884 RepID=A0ABW3FYL0_9PSEU|nr:hypothetical protein [Saccharopolyspora rosea]